MRTLQRSNDAIMRRLVAAGRVVDGMLIPKMCLLKVNCTYRCDRCCPNCNRFTRIAPSNRSEDLSPEQLDAVLTECAANGTRWNRVVLTGGEPSLHPRLEELVDVLFKHRVRLPRIATFHHPVHYARIEKLLAKYPRLGVIDSSKDVPEPHPVASAMAPQDQPEFAGHRYVGCPRVILGCGPSLDYKGFYVCPVAGAIARVFKLDIAIKRAQDLTTENLIKQYQQVCCKCGHYTSVSPSDVTKDCLSKSWQEATRAL